MEVDFSMENNKSLPHSLSSSDWGKIYNVSILDNIVQDLNQNKLSWQSKELIKLSSTGTNILEIGCGSGATSVYLAKELRKVTAIDFSEESITLTNALADRMNIDKKNLKTYLLDAQKELPFVDNQFDIIFQAGLLEHFEKDERIQLLKNWSRCGKTMVSIIPNAASIAYRVGKEIMERNGTWEYGKEIPQYSMADEFNRAGINTTKEYTIGEEHSLEFLPSKHYLRRSLSRWIKENQCSDNCGQGYLLVTIGEKIKE